MAVWTRGLNFAPRGVVIAEKSCESRLPLLIVLIAASMQQRICCSLLVMLIGRRCALPPTAQAWIGTTTRHINVNAVDKPLNGFRFRPPRRTQVCFMSGHTAANADNNHLSDHDRTYLQQAIDHAKHGLGHTFPNPAVGCVLVDNVQHVVLGAGFHPRAGFPHAEIFALWAAAGHVPNGVQAAHSVVHNHDHKVRPLVQQLTAHYCQESGPEELLADVLVGKNVTAYVTLEPCCHYGQTPPCAMALAWAGVQRVVIGYRDPNPRVNGGGVQLLQDLGVEVFVVEAAPTGDCLQQQCADLVQNFVKRITPRGQDSSIIPLNGARRRALRAHANRLKAAKEMVTVEWDPNADVVVVDVGVSPSSSLPAPWMEQVDNVLWQHEVVLLRLNAAVQKKKDAKTLGLEIAAQLGAEVVQVLGHTVLLYRPGIPPILDVHALLETSIDEKKEDAHTAG